MSDLIKSIQFPLPDENGCYYMYGSGDVPMAYYDVSIIPESDFVNRFKTDRAIEVYIGDNPFTLLENVRKISFATSFQFNVRYNSDFVRLAKSKEFRWDEKHDTPEVYEYDGKIYVPVYFGNEVAVLSQSIKNIYDAFYKQFNKLIEMYYDYMEKNG